MAERFDCHHCNESLFGKKYILREESPFCVACFEDLYANTCEECGKPIGCDCKVPIRSWSSQDPGAPDGAALCWGPQPCPPLKAVPGAPSEDSAPFLSREG